MMTPDCRCGGVFLGPSGCGKSSAAAYAVLRWLGRAGSTGASGKPVSWLDAIVATDAEKRYRLGSGDPEHLADAYRAEWLVIDDIGLSTSPVLLQSVLARRYQAGLPTITTTGLTREQLSEHIGAATLRRMVEFKGQKGLLVDCHGRDS
jgi:DNA replication protein DnaC